MRLHLIVAALALSSACFVAKADTVDFTYMGTASGTSVSGSGSFAFAGAPPVISLADLTSFSFADTFVGGNTSNFTYGLGDLSAFAATLSGTTLRTLSLQTGFVNGTNPAFAPEDFTITSLSTKGATTTSNQGEGLFPETSHGTVTASVIPEPSSIALLGTGLLVLAGMVRRRFA